jgi:hypothetical protein
MIPIECPKCGRGGSVPPDRLNARLVCKACHTVFHLDNTGRMVMGEPESFDMKTTKSRADEVSSLADFDLAQTWNDIPTPVKYGVPGVLLAAIIFLNWPVSNKIEHESRAEAIMQAVTANKRDTFISYATPDSAEAAGQMFDLIHGEIEKGQFGNDSKISPQLLSGTPEKGGDITMLVVISKNGSSDLLTVNMPMKKGDNGDWLLEGNAGFQTAQQSSSSSKKN